MKTDCLIELMQGAQTRMRQSDMRDLGECKEVMDFICDVIAAMPNWMGRGVWITRMAQQIAVRYLDYLHFDYWEAGIRGRVAERRKKRGLPV